MTQHNTSFVQNESGERSPKTILQILPALDGGGVERGTIEMAAAIKAVGWNPIVVSNGGKMVYELDRIGATHLTLPVHAKKPWTMYRNTKRLSHIIREYGVDLVHARSRAPAWSAYGAAKATGVPYVTTFHAAYTRGGFLKNWYNGIMARGERVIAISDFIKNHITDHYQVDPSKVVTIPRGVDCQKFNPGAVSAERIIKMATDWALPDGVPVVMLPGRLTRLKGHVELIKALAQMPDKNFVALFVGAGQGREAYREEITNLVRANGLEGKVQIKDYCSDMAAALMLADVVVSASNVPEGFGRISVEAQAMGRPVIATAHGGSLETVLNGETGWLVPVGDIAAMSEALNAALHMGGEARERVAVNARNHVTNNFTVAKMCDSTLAVYAEVLAEKAGRG
ncbi:MAG: glycosyltransferase family 4 protein [Sneathiella sp.]|nr:glycosyltransferase family 4 protein [Sneathiella sp.]